MSEEKDQDMVQVSNNEMVLDDILGDDIIGESSDHEGEKKEKAPRKDSEPSSSKKRSRNNSYASTISSTGSVSKRRVNWENLDARYFVIKSNNMDNVEIAMEKSVWATPRRNENMLVEAFRHTKHVILVFSVRESGHFQGVARMMSMPRPNRGEVNWIVGHTPILRMLPNLFKIQWLDRTALDFTRTTHIKNRWNDWKQVKISRDGQELEPVCATDLCALWNNCEDPDSHIPVIPSRKKSESESAARSSRSDEPVSPSAVKTTYSTYKDESYKKSSPEPMSDSSEPPPPGLSSKMKDRLGSKGAEELRKKRREEPAARPRRHREENRSYNRDTSRYNRGSRTSAYNRDNDTNNTNNTNNRRERYRENRDTRPRSSHASSTRHRSRSPRRRSSPPAERAGSSAKDILLHGSYLEYVKEYQSKHSRLAALLQDPVLRQDIFNAAQVAASGSSSRSSSSRRRKEEKYLDSRAHSALVDEFLSTHTRR